MVGADTDAEITAWAMIQVQAKVILVVATAVQYDAVFTLIHVGEEPVGLSTVLRNVERVSSEIAGIEEAIHLIVERARLERIILKACIDWVGNPQFARNDLAGNVQKLALLVRQERVLLRPVHLACEFVVSVLGTNRELGRALGQPRTTARADLDHARGRTRSVQRRGRSTLHHFHALDVHRLEIGARRVERRRLDDAIHHNKRGRALADRRGRPQLNIRAASGLSGRNHAHAGNLALNRLERVGSRDGSIFGAHAAN